MKNQSRCGISMRGAYRPVKAHARVKMSAKGRATVMVLDEHRDPVQVLEENNLILNSGIEMVRMRPWVDNFAYAVLGNGTAPTSVDSGVTTATQSGTTVTLSGGTFTFTDTATDEGKIIRWDTAQLARIVSVTSPTEAEVAETQAVGPGEFTVFNTNQTAADMTEIQRTNNYVTAGGGCDTTIVDGQITFKRTFDFPVEVAPVTYTELAFSHSVTGGDDIFSRILLSAPLVMVPGQAVRVVYTLELELEPWAPSNIPANILGWPVAPSTTTDGTQQIQLVALARVNPVTGEKVVEPTAGLSLEPSSDGVDCSVFLSTVSTAPAAFNDSVDRTGTAPAIKDDTAIDPATVTTSVGFHEKVVLYEVTEGNRTDWRSMGVGTYDVGGPVYPYVVTGFVFVFDEDQTKDELHTLELRFAYYWGRVL